jgi:glutathione transport system ATP-binding protein
MSHRVAVLYLGQVAELGSRQQVLENPSHPYTQRLLSAVPVADPTRNVNRTMLDGEIPSPVRRVGDEPAIVSYQEIAPGHLVANAV